MIGERLAQLRTMHNMTQEEFAERLDVSRQAVSKWELDKTMPDVGKLLKISELYEVSVDYLLKGEESIQTSVEPENDELVPVPLQSEENDIEENYTEENYTNGENKYKAECTNIKPDKKVKSAGIFVSLVLVSILLFGSMFLLARCLLNQVWDKTDSERALVRVEKIHAQYSLADVSGYGEDGTFIETNVLLDANGVRSGDYIYCYTNAAKNKISVNYAADTIIIILTVSIILLSIWILLLREVRRK